MQLSSSSTRLWWLAVMIVMADSSLHVDAAAAAASSVNRAKMNAATTTTTQNNDNDSVVSERTGTANKRRIGFRWWNNNKGSKGKHMASDNKKMRYPSWTMTSLFSSSSKRKKQSSSQDSSEEAEGETLSLSKKQERNESTSAIVQSVNQTLVKQIHARLKALLSLSSQSPSSMSASEASPSSSPSWDEHWKRQRDQFMDRVALISSWLMSSSQSDLDDADDGTTIVDPNEITHQSNLDTWPPRGFHIVTTASLPWMTGTAVNPLLRAAYLYDALMERQEKEQQQQQSGDVVENLVSVTLVVPWLERPQDQEELYHRVFESPQEQEAFIRNWLKEQADMPEAAKGVQILWYPGRYHKELGSIFAMGDMIQDVILMNNQTALDVCILEEPEHCNWYRAPSVYSWTTAFRYVVGVVHTNYKEYAAGRAVGLFTAPALAMICSAMVRAYCHRVVKLSDTLQAFCPEKEVTSNVHGVRKEFWLQGLALSKELEKHGEEDLLVEPRVYFLGKLLWAKGLDLLLDLEEYYHQMTGSYFDIDIYGSGPDSEAIQRAFQKTTQRQSNGSILKIVAADGESATPAALPFVNASTTLLNSFGNGLHVMAKQHWSSLKNSFLTQMEMTMPKTLVMAQMWRRSSRDPIPANFPGRVDHAHLPKPYSVFVNPSISEVLCTCTAEALAMGKFAIVPFHPSNYFFLQQPNCLPYRNRLEFVANLRWALTHNPKPLTEEQARQFSWEAATHRLFQAAAMTHREAAAAMDGSSKLEGERIAWFHNEVLGKGKSGDFMRRLLGAGPVSDQVKWSHQRNQGIGLEDDKEDETEDGLGKAFSESWFVKSIRSAWTDLVSFGGVA